MQSTPTSPLPAVTKTAAAQPTFSLLKKIRTNQSENWAVFPIKSKLLLEKARMPSFPPHTHFFFFPSPPLFLKVQVETTIPRILLGKK